MTHSAGVDFEQILVIVLGSLVVVNFFAALALTVDWDGAGERWKRTRRYIQIGYEQWELAVFDAKTLLEWRRFLRWSGRAAWATALAVVALMGFR